MKKITIEKEIEKYLREVKSYIFCDSKIKTELEKDIENSIYDYAELKGITNISAIYNKFGSPEELAKMYLSQAEPQKIKRTINIRKVLTRGILVMLVIFLFFYIASAIVINRDDSFGKSDLIETTNSINIEVGEEQ